MADNSPEQPDSPAQEEVETYADAEEEEVDDETPFDDPRRSNKQTIEQETLAKLAIVTEINPYQAPEKTPESKQLWQTAIDKCVEQGIYVNMNSKKPPRSMLQQLVNRYVTEFRQKYPSRLTVDQENKLNEREKYAKILVNQLRKRPKRWFDKASNTHVVVAHAPSGEKRQKVSHGAGGGNLVKVEHLLYSPGKEAIPVVTLEHAEPFDPVFSYGNDQDVVASAAGMANLNASSSKIEGETRIRAPDDCSSKCSCQKEFKQSVFSLIKCMQDNTEMLRSHMTVEKETRDRELQLRRDEAEKDRDMQLTLARQAQESQAAQLKLILEAALKLATSGKSSGS